jgi:hypothetical protein
MARAIWMTLGIGLGLALSACSGAEGGVLEHESETLDSAGTPQPALDASQEDSEIGSVAQPLVRGGGGGGLGYSCSGLVCTCTGDEDCNDMFGDGVCGDVASCDTTNPQQPICRCSILRVSHPSTALAVKAGTLTPARE